MGDRGGKMERRGDRLVEDEVYDCDDSWVSEMASYVC